MARSVPKEYEADEEVESTFTMIYDLVAKEWGLVTAAVYGVVHRHCLMREGVCRASTRRLGELVGLNHNTVQRELWWLCELGFIYDTTPGRRNKPHVYKDWFLEDPPPRAIMQKKDK